jgi:hemolysin III
MTDPVKTSKDGSVHVTDEKFNTVSHMAAAMFALLGAVVLILKASLAGNVWAIVGFSLYGLSLMLVFSASALHHGLDGSPRVEGFFRLLDYLVIFGLIAGTYTPLCLIVSRDIWGWSVFGVVWGLAAAGISLKAVFPRLPKWITNTVYVSMGWIGTILIFLIREKIGLISFLLIVGGGIFYSAGSVIFYREKPNPLPGKFGFHEIWHLCVIAGAFCHYLALYRLPL